MLLKLRKGIIFVILSVAKYLQIVLIVNLEILHSVPFRMTILRRVSDVISFQL